MQGIAGQGNEPRWVGKEQQTGGEASATREVDREAGGAMSEVEQRPKAAAHKMRAYGYGGRRVLPRHEEIEKSGFYDERRLTRSIRFILTHERLFT
jgi:hypothetical protein